jgi:hypothetical protein
VATRLNAPDRERFLIRRLRVLNFSGWLLDEDETITRAAIESELDPDELAEWTAQPRVEEQLRADMAAARQPLPAARVLDERLANWSGGRRYTCPSYEITRLADGVTISVPGFQPFAAYDVVLANLVPGLDRCEPPEGVAEVLDWAAVPLASQEVATVLDIEIEDAREQLGRVADEEHVGADGLWTLRNYLYTAARPEAKPRTWRLLVSVGDPAAVEVVRRELDLHAVARENSNVVAAHLAADVPEDLMVVVELDLEHGVGQGLGDLALHLNFLFLTQAGGG